MSMAPTSGNCLYYGDNLKVLREHIADESVDLIYLDPPFNSNADYNVLFSEKDGSQAASQIKAFGDTWHWNTEAARNFTDAIEHGGDRVAKTLMGFRALLGTNDMLAYLAMMAPRLCELRRVLKPTGSIYLHCDPTASHYLKLLMDAVFGPDNFKNEIIWKRTGSHNDAQKFADIHDCIFYYSRTKRAKWNPQFIAHEKNYLRTHYNRTDEDGRQYRLDNIIRSASMGPRPNLVYEYKGFTPPWGWRTVRAKLEVLDKDNRLMWTASGTPYLVRYLDEMKGAATPTIWDDIPPINSQAQERLGYPTQKPEALLERMITASSDKGDVVLDPFCGCGTAVAAAQNLKRRWIGIDITHLAIGLIKHRLFTAFGERINKTYKVVGEPEDLRGAAQLAADDPYQFQWWALSLVNARPAEQKKGADKGIDGRLYFHDEAISSAQTKQVIFSVKAGHTGPAHVRDLGFVLEREQAQIGVLISMQEPTQPMRTEAASAGFYKSIGGTQFPRLQILTIRELLDGRKVELPAWHDDRTFKAAPKAKEKSAEEPRIEGLE